MDLNKLAVRVAVFKALRDRITASYDAARQDLGQHLGPEGRRNAMVADAKIASMSVSKAGRITVTDERALADWVAAHYPTEVEQKPSVRPAFLRLIRECSEAAGEPCGPGGELDIPGLAIGEPYVIARWAPGGEELIGELWRQGRIGIEDGVIREIEEGQ